MILLGLQNHFPMKKNFLLLFCSLLTLSLQAQSEPCGFDYVQKQLYDNCHDCLRGKKEILSRDVPTSKRSFNQIYTIPVVVHDVYKNESTVLTSEEVEAVMASVTADFRHQNADTALIRDIFRDLATDTEIEFKLHDIIHVQSDATFGFDLLTGLPDHVKDSNAGGSDAVDPDHYLNIWVCNLEDGLLGYAYPPDGLDNWPNGSGAASKGIDGVVIGRTAFTTDAIIEFGNEEIVMKGRTITHEIGHYLGLRHIWGDGFSILGIAACDEDDGVEDTPNQGFQTEFSCDTTLNTCGSGEGDLPDMIENHMDYSSEDCKSAFTFGQSQIMRGVLENERSGLLDDGSSTLDIDSKSSDIIIDCYPNPSDGVIKLSSNQNDRFEVQIYSLLGHKVHAVANVDLASGRSERIDLSSLSSGVYIAVFVGEKYVSTKKVILH